MGNSKLEDIVYKNLLDDCLALVESVALSYCTYSRTHVLIYSRMIDDVLTDPLGIVSAYVGRIDLDSLAEDILAQLITRAEDRRKRTISKHAN